MMRLGLLTVTAFAVLVPRAATAGDPAKMMVELRSGLINPGLPMAESDFGAYGVSLLAKVDKEGGGRGTLEIDPNAPAAPTFDEFGFRMPAAALPSVKLECTLKFVKKRKVFVPLENRIGGPEREEEWLLFAIEGPKLTSRLSLAMLADGSSGRLLMHGKDGKVKYVVDVRTPPPPPPCHPGCFPAGTVIHVPGGTNTVERIREGDLVTTVGPDGKTSQAKVASVFATKNRLLKVHTAAGDLVTTDTQPLALAGGGLKPAGELKPGDRILRWDGGECRATTVQSVSPTGREEQVFNLILGDPALFVANGFVARSKPPALSALPERVTPDVSPPLKRE
jgi:hypothetical protein